MKTSLCIAFAAVQIAGFVLPYFANVHSNPAPLIFGVLLLMPGSLGLFLLGSVANHINGIVQAVFIVTINAFSWYAIAAFVLRARNNLSAAKEGDKDTSSS